MDWDNPLRSIATTVDVDVLQVLGNTHKPVTGNQLANLAGRSYAQVWAVLDRLVRHGLVLTEQHGRTHTYVLNRDHVLAHGLLHILDATARIEQVLASEASEWEPAARSVALFGSAARRGATADSDLDLLVVRPNRVSEDDSSWAAQVGGTVQRLELLTGNPVQLVQLSEDQLEEAVRTKQPLVASLRRDARTIIGDNLHRILDHTGEGNHG